MAEESNPTPAPEATIEEDDSLDNFFKKKEKKDKKGKKKKGKKADKVFVAGNLGEDAEATKSKKKDTDNKKETDNVVEGNTQPEQEEWIDFEDESQRDYSDLKIQNMQISNDGSEAQFSEAPEYDEAGELIPPKQDEGPWNKISAAAQEPAPKPEEPKPEPEPVKKMGAYRPPQARSGGASLAAAPLRRGRKQQAPEISNEMDFPSLSAASQDTVSHTGFEVVKTGVKSSVPWRSKHQQAQASELKLGNQFSALNTNH
ncbi:protein CDV3 homolog A-like isoform X2 [Clavelina lepadiformis]|uniref:protein CDV3 homolog A-like isoform X2 n=1 Tax=Clavelina lepadiformis TaxID=159417 RepID=UPI00404242AD